VNISAEDLHKVHTKKQMIDFIKSEGFDVVRYKVASGSELNQKMLCEKLSEARRTSPYELDGVVLTVDKFRDMDTLSTSQTLNPEHSVKFKMIDEDSTVETLVSDVIWDVSKSGFLKPR